MSASNGSTSLPLYTCKCSPLLPREVAERDWCQECHSRPERFEAVLSIIKVYKVEETEGGQEMVA